MHQLYPQAQALAMCQIDVGEGHRIHVEEYGNPAGKPVVFIHGGPGSGCSAGHSRFFDPAHYRILLWDQRGCGRSIPLGETRANTTQILIQDLEVVRREFDIGRWILFGGSWGATLALLYAQTFPEAVSALVLRGSFLARREDMEWFFGGSGVARVFPEAYGEFVAPVPAGERHDLISAYHRRIHGPVPDVAISWARTWIAWEDRVATWTLPQPQTQEAAEPQRLLAKARIEVHYALNRYFLSDRPLLDAAAALPKVPIAIVHGRRDLACPFEAAWALYLAISGSRLVAVAEAGHLAVEPEMTVALVEEMDRLRSYRESTR